MSSWSGWIVATMSRIGPDLGRSISSIRIRLVGAAGASAIVPALRGDGVGIVEPAEEERSVGQVVQCLGPAVQVGLEIFLGDRVAAEGAKREHILAHEPEGLAGPAQMCSFCGED